MNLIDLENRIYTKEEVFKTEILNLKESNSTNDKKYLLSTKITILLQLIIFLCYVIFTYFIIFKDEDLIVVLFCSYFLFLIYIIYFVLSSGCITNIINKYFYKGISSETYWHEFNRFKILNSKLPAFEKNIETFKKCKNRYDELLLNKEKLFIEETSFINTKAEWESKIAIKIKEYKETTVYTFLDFFEYEFLKKEYYNKIESNFRYYFNRIDDEIEELVRLLKEVEISLDSGRTVYFNSRIFKNNDHQFTIQTFEEFLRNRTKKTEIKDKEKRVRVSGSRKRKIDNGYIKPLHSKENIDIDVNKFDNQQHVKNINLGLIGELFVLEYEKKRLINQGRLKLAEKVQHVSKLYGDRHGYDVLSYDNNGKSKWIEVKTTTGNVSDDFYLSENEYNTMINSKRYFIYRVYDFNIEENTGQIREIQCSNEMDRLNFNVTKFKVQPNKLLNATTRGLE